MIYMKVFYVQKISNGLNVISYTVCYRGDTKM